MQRTAHYIAWGGGAERRLDGSEAGRRHEPLAAAAVLGCREDLERGPSLEPDGSLDREHELDVERVAAVAGNDVRPDRAAQEGQVPDQVQHLVPDELVPVSKAVQRPAIAEHDRVVQGATPREAVLSHEP